jgi:hypothetical protein
MTQSHGPSFLTAKFFVSSPEVGAACQQPPVHPLVVLCFSVSHPPTTVNTYFERFLMKSRFRRRRSSKAVLDAPMINGLRPAGAGQTQGSCSPGVRPTLTIEDLGTSKPTSCPEFCVAHSQIKSISPVSINFVNFVIADHSIDFNDALSVHLPCQKTTRKSK